MIGGMADVTRILEAIEAGDPEAAAELLPLVYGELRKLAAARTDDDLLALDEALTRLAATDPAAARLVELRYFGGLGMPEAAAALGVPLRTAERDWAYARAWLHRTVAGDGSPDPR